jgi:2-oxo-4-hydroxy-4-carboxy-5-ureidoimidazoline decarboxylase
MPEAATLYRIADVGRWERQPFVDLLGGVFEHSPWVAELAWPQRPFADVAALHACMVGMVRQAPLARQLALLCAHPQLAGREAQTGTLTESSDQEQLSAGLKSLRAEEMQRIAALNAAYLRKHGFPFIVCVRHYTKDGIFHEFERRLAHDTARERDEALNQVAAITRLRLQALFPDH